MSEWSNANAPFILAARKWNRDRAPMLAAAIAFYAIFSVAPLLLLLLSLAVRVFGAEAARGDLVDAIRAIVGGPTASAIQALIASASRSEKHALATTVGLALVLFGSSGVFRQLKTSLNIIFETPPHPSFSVLRALADRAIAIAMVIVVGVFLLASMLIIAFFADIRRIGRGGEPMMQFAVQSVELVVFFTILFTTFWLVFRFVPDAPVAWREARQGAFLSSLLFTVGQFGIGLYLGNTPVATSYGAAGSLVVILLWAYFSAMILFYGAEYTHALGVIARKAEHAGEPRVIPYEARRR